MAILKNIEKQTDNKFLNMYNLKYHNDKTGKDFNYFVASRNDEDTLVAKTGDHSKANAVMMIPMFENDDLVLIKQFRPAINDYIYEFPAGLVDENESIEDAMKRELFEETGLNIVDYTRIVKPSYTSAGMSDESLSIYLCDVEGEISTEYKEENEDIEVVIVKMADAKKFIEENNVAIKASLAMSFLYAMDKLR